MFGKDTSAPISIYVILFSTSVRPDYTGNKQASGKLYAYVGSSDNVDRRMFEHITELRAGRKNAFMQHVYDKYGIDKVSIAYTGLSEQERLAYEQAVYDDYASKGYELVNGITPIQCRCADYSFRSLQANRQILSNGQKRRYARQDEHERQSIKMIELYHTEHMQQKLRAVHNTPLTKLRHSLAAKANAKTAGAKISQKQRCRWCSCDSILRLLQRQPTNRLYLAMRVFYLMYGTADIWRYTTKQDKFEPWMHFIIQSDDTVVVFAWDTRNVLFQCKKSDLPAGYIHLKLSEDTYQQLNYSYNA